MRKCTRSSKYLLEKPIRGILSYKANTGSPHSKQFHRAPKTKICAINDAMNTVSPPKDVVNNQKLFVGEGNYLVSFHIYLGEHESMHILLSEILQ